MFAHIIIYFILSALSATMVYAASTPVGRSSQDQVQSVEEENDLSGSL